MTLCHWWYIMINLNYHTLPLLLHNDHLKCDTIPPLLHNHSFELPHSTTGDVKRHEPIKNKLFYHDYNGIKLINICTQMYDNGLHFHIYKFTQVLRMNNF